MSGGGGGSSQPTSQTVTQSNIPKELMPYAMTNLGKAQALVDQKYQPYQGQQVAGFSDMQNQAFRDIGNQQVAGQLGEASGLASMVGRQAGQYQNYQPTQFGNQYQDQTAGSVDLGYQNVTNPNLQTFQMGPADQVASQNFGGQAAQDYMSPYMQNVVEQQKQGAVQDYARSIPGMGSNAARMGGLGGSRNAIVQAEAQRNLGGQLQGIQATGSQAAFQNAQAQFNQDQARQMQARLANQGANLTVGQQNLAAQLGVQNLGAGQNLQAQLANQQAGLNTNQMRLSQQQGLNQFGLTNAANRAQYGLAGQQASEASRQFGANLGMQALQRQLEASGQLGNLGNMQYQQESGLNQARMNAGSLQQQLAQRQLDQERQNFNDAQNYQYKNLGFMSDLLRGTPTGNKVETMYGGQPSTASQVAGLGTLLYGSGMKG